MSEAGLPVIAVTVGEPAGIGPEISLRAAWQLRAQMRPVLIGDAAYLAMLAEQIDPAMRLLAISSRALSIDGLPACPADRITVIDCPLSAHVQAGVPDPRNGRAVLRTLDLAMDMVQQGHAEAMVTAPLQKSTINDAGVPFSGHTEYLAERSATAQVVMMLACEANAQLPQPLRVALATTHLPLRKVADAIRYDELLNTVRIIDADLRSKFGIAKPRILLTGLNPHAGENGYLGSEEIDIISPVIAAAQQAGINALGPYPADTLFQQKYLAQADCVLAMYHDQGLAVLKHASFGLGVNITLGLPLIRTSVDHGTALDLAARGCGHADIGSMLVAMRSAAAMCRQQKQS